MDFFTINVFVNEGSLYRKAIKMEDVLFIEEDSEETLVGVSSYSIKKRKRILEVYNTKESLEEIIKNKQITISYK